MSRDVETPSKPYNSDKHKPVNDQLSSKKRKRRDNAIVEFTTTTPVVAKRRRHEDNSDAVKSTPYSQHIPHSPSEDASSNRDSSPFYTQTTSFYLPLSPIGLSHPLESLCAEHFSPLLLTYYSPLNGVVLSYQNARLSNHASATSTDDVGVLAKSVDEYAVSYVWVTADFTILKPRRGMWIEGHVSVQSESHLGLVCWNLFNASIDSKRLPKRWRWIGSSSKHKRKHQKNTDQNMGNEEDVADGHFIDANGENVEGVLRFRVKDLENLADFGRDKGFMSIKGTFLTEEEEKQLSDEETRRFAGSRDEMGQRIPRIRERTADV